MERKGILAVFLMLVFLSYSPWALAQDESDIKSLWKEGLELYDRGQFEEAYQKANAALLKRPNSELAIELREIAGMQRMMQMLVKGGKWHQVARALLERAERAQFQRETDLSLISKLVDQAATGNLIDRTEAIIKLETSVGERAVIYMVPYLKNKTQDLERINIIYAGIKMGRLIVVPLIECLNSTDAFLRQQVVILLGHIGDWRALPDLKCLIENPKETEQVKKYARDSVSKIQSISAETLNRLSMSPNEEAKVLYYKKAMAYYFDNPEIYPVQRFDWLRWKWQDEELVFQELPSIAYNEAIAEETCYDALDLDAGYADVWALLLRIFYAQANQVDAVESAAKERGLDIPENEKEWFEKDKLAATWAKVIAAAGGPDALYRALANALENKDEVPVACSLIKALSDEVITGETPKAPLISALRHDDKRIKYAAAEALIKIKPLQSFTDSQLVVKVMEEALGESDARVVLVIEDEDDVRNELVAALNTMKPGFTSFGANTGIDGLRRSKLFPSEDLIIIEGSLKDKDLGTVQLVNSLQEDFRTLNIPFLIISPEAEKETHIKLYQNMTNFKGVISKPLKKEEYESKVKEGIEGSKDDYKAKAQEIARRAAEALSTIDPETSIYKLSDALDGLIGVLEKRHDSIRGPALIALGKIGNPKAIPELVKLIVDTNVDVAIRIKAALALGKVYAKTQIKVATQDLDNLISVIGEKNQGNELKSAVAQALGQANLSPEERLKTFKVHRPHQNIEKK